MQPSRATTQLTQSAGDQYFMPPRGLELMTQLVDVRGQPTPYQLDHKWTIEQQNFGYKYSILFIIIFTNKFFPYEVLMVEGVFKFFEFEDLRLEFCGGFVAIGRCKQATLATISRINQ